MDDVENVMRSLFGVLIEKDGRKVLGESRWASREGESAIDKAANRSPVFDLLEKFSHGDVGREDLYQPIRFSGIAVDSLEFVAPTLVECRLKEENDLLHDSKYSIKWVCCVPEVEGAIAGLVTFLRREKASFHAEDLV